MDKKPSAIVHLQQVVRGGVLYLSSTDLPGLWLWGKDHEKVFKSVIPTIEKLYELNEGRSVEIKEACEKDATRTWFGRDRMCETFEVYYTNNKIENAAHGQVTME